MAAENHWLKISIWSKQRLGFVVKYSKFNTFSFITAFSIGNFANFAFDRFCSKSSIWDCFLSKGLFSFQIQLTTTNQEQSQLLMLEKRDNNILSARIIHNQLSSKICSQNMLLLVCLESCQMHTVLIDQCWNVTRLTTLIGTRLIDDYIISILQTQLKVSTKLKRNKWSQFVTTVQFRCSSL